MTDYVVAIDNGSQSTKVSVVDPGGGVLREARRRLRPYRHPEPGHVVHPDDDVWDSIREACADALADFDHARDSIVGVGLCTIRFCRALLDAEGRLVEPLWSWMDARVSQPYDEAVGARWVTTSSGYITHRLTGATRDTRANYEGAWPIDPGTGDWPQDAAGYAGSGLSRGLLFDLVDPGALLGRITPDAAAATLIPVDTPVFATANDKAVEALGAGLTGPGSALITLGTYIAAMTVAGSDVVESPPDGSFWLNSAAIPGSRLAESRGIRRGMWTVSWLRELLGDPAATTEEREAVLDAEVASVAPGSDGVVVLLDWLAPADAAFRRGSLLGFDGTQGRPQIYRATLEAIAMTMHAHLRSMEHALGRPSADLIVSGGGAGSDSMMQILADVTGRPVRRTARPDAAGVGAAITAAVGAGLHPSWADAAAAMVRPGPVFAPDAAAQQTYRRLQARYERIRDHTDPLYRLLADR